MNEDKEARKTAKEAEKEEQRKRQEQEDREFKESTKSFFKTFGRAFVSGAKMTGNFVKRTYTSIKDDVEYKDELEKMTMVFRIIEPKGSFRAIDEVSTDGRFIVTEDYLKVAATIKEGTIIEHANNGLRYEVESIDLNLSVKREWVIKGETIEIVLFQIFVKRV